MILDRLPRRSLLCALSACLLTAVAACSATQETHFTGAGASSGVGAGTGTGTETSTTTGAGAGSTGTTGSGAGGSTGAGFFDGGLGGSGGGTPGCAAATQFVYTLTAANELYKFDPPTLAFTLVGIVNCPNAQGTPFSMAVDRSGSAWSVFTDGSVYQIDTSNAACKSTLYVAGQSGWSTFGMGFSADTPGGTAETLYVSESSFLSGGATKGLGRIDLTTMKLVPIGMYDKINARAELTGTGDAKLFGAFEGMPYDVAQIDKTGASILSEAPQSAINYAPDSSNFAFAFWGGDFWLFVGPGTSTDVFHYQVASGVTTKVKTVSFEIVGAGVSTCAPTKPTT